MIKVKPLVCGALCLSICITAIALAFSGGAQSDNISGEAAALTLWQIDSFEGGTGSRAAYLQKKGDNFCKSGGVYVKVLSLSADAARENLANGNYPDLLSFGAGEWGLESYLTGESYIWCYGGYCLLTLEQNCGFGDVNSQNTVINIGKNNLSSAAALFYNLSEAETQSPTAAYVSLINGKYKYLLGTQRDIYRLKARNASYSVKPISEFNDLYQLIYICSYSQNISKSGEFISYLSQNNSDVYTLGLLGGDVTGAEVDVLSGINYEYTIKTPVSESAGEEIKRAINAKDINKLKTLLK